VVRKVLKSERDDASLQKIRSVGAVVNNEQPQSYRDRVVLKPWGHEFLVFENPYVAIWFLHIKEEFATSMHCHPSKRTSLILLSGRAFCNTLNHRIFLDCLDAAVFEKGVFHSTKALSQGGIDLIEVETPPQKTDLVRLNDGYGRQSFGYEGLAEMRKSDLDRFGYFHLEEPETDAPSLRTEKHYEIRVDRYRETSDFRERFRPRPGEIVCPCRGAIEGGDGSLLLDIGEARTASEMPATDSCRLPGPLTLITSFRSPE
jgi:hypothetical protein